MYKEGDKVIMIDNSILDAGEIPLGTKGKIVDIAHDQKQHYFVEWDRKSVREMCVRWWVHHKCIAPIA